MSDNKIPDEIWASGTWMKASSTWVPSVSRWFLKKEHDDAILYIRTDKSIPISELEKFIKGWWGNRDLYGHDALEAKVICKFLIELQNLIDKGRGKDE